MKFPFVSRDRLEEVQKQLAESQAECRRLMDLLLTQAASHVSVEEDDGIRPVGKSTERSPISFTTPIDRVLSRFDEAHKGGLISPQFKARVR